MGRFIREQSAREGVNVEGIGTDRERLTALVLLAIESEGDRLRTAIDRALNTDGVKTGDLGGNATTKQFTEAVVSRIRNG